MSESSGSPAPATASGGKEKSEPTTTTPVATGSESQPAVEPVADPKPAVEPVFNRIINDVSIHVATANGSGSQSANTILTRSIFQMGVPVSGKNLFPSNIQGMPTWFTIRVNADGWVARKRDVDILVAMNPQTAVDDVKELRTGAVCISPLNLGLDKVRTDVTHYQIPFAELAAAATDNVKIRKLVLNMVYVGVLGQLLEIDSAELDIAVRRQFKGKESAIKANLAALEKGRQWVKENIKKTDDFVVRKDNKTAGKILIDGNSAAAVGCLFAGVSVLAWYPITPSSSVCESLIEYLQRFRRMPDGKPTFAVIQAEDELAALGIAIGAGWTGARSMTATSGPGISLMAEFTGLGYFAEIPTVVFDVQRVGPSTGLPTRTAQGDISFVHGLSHGDTKHVMLLPGTVEECYSLSMAAFDLAERLQTPVFVISELDLGMNTFMSDPFKYPDKPMDRGEVLSAEDLTRLGKFERYGDTDGDGVCARTVPGTNHPLAGYFTRGSGHNRKAGYSEKPSDYRELVDRLALKYNTARTLVPKPNLFAADGARIGIVAYGSSHLPLLEAQHQLKQAGIAADYMQLRALPFTDEVRQFVESHDRVYVVEQNRDGQMRDLLRLEMPDLTMKLRSVLHYNGLPLHARFVCDAIAAAEKEVK